MKTLTGLIAFTFLVSGWMPLQSQSYTVTVSNKTFDFLDEGNLAFFGIWDDPGYTVPVGFEYELFGETSSHLYAWEDFFGPILSANLNGASLNLMVLFSTDLIDRGFELDTPLSPILYHTEGPVGERVFTLEYNNAGFWNGELQNGIYVDFINLQLRIYEETGDFEYHIGPYSVTNPAADFEGESGPGMGVIEGLDYNAGNINGEILLLKGNPLSPQIETSNPDVYLTWPIPVGTVYRFSNEPTAVSDPVLESSAYYYPNPCREFVALRSEFSDEIKSSVYIINSVGEVVGTDNDPDIIELENFSAGIYTLKFLTSGGQVSQRISLVK